PTSTGLPRSRGFSTCSTEAKNASTSTWTMLGILRAGALQRPSQAQADQGFLAVAGSGCGSFAWADSAGLWPAHEFSVLPRSLSSASSARSEEHTSELQSLAYLV